MYDLNHRLNHTTASQAGKKISASRGKLLGDVTMKMVKKILLGLAAGAAVLSMVGCKGVTVGGDDSIEGTIVNGTTSKAYVGKKDGEGCANTTANTIREMKLFSTKHYGAFAALTLTDEDKNANTGNGQLGYAFNYTENEDGTVNFITIGFRWDSKQYDTYVSQYYNVDTTKFSTKNFGVSAKKTAYDSTVNTPYEIEVATLPTQLSFVTMDEEGSATVGVNVIAEDDGSYTIKYYSADKLENYKLKNADATADKTITVSNEVTGRDTKKQTKMGCYAAVYGNKTLNGFWRFSSIKGEDLPVEGFED